MQHQSILSSKGDDPFTLDEDAYRIIGHQESTDFRIKIDLSSR
jgi:hypothetical protein